jgi:hypothetical protein
MQYLAHVGKNVHPVASAIHIHRVVGPIDETPIGVSYTVLLSGNRKQFKWQLQRRSKLENPAVIEIPPRIVVQTGCLPDRFGISIANLGLPIRFVRRQLLRIEVLRQFAGGVSQAVIPGAEDREVGRTVVARFCPRVDVMNNDLHRWVTTHAASVSIRDQNLDQIGEGDFWTRPAMDQFYGFRRKAEPRKRLYAGPLSLPKRPATLFERLRETTIDLPSHKGCDSPI